MEPISSEKNFFSICSQLSKDLNDLNTSVFRLVNHLQSANISQPGFSILDVKNDTLSSYIANVACIVMNKCFGISLQTDQQAIERLVESRVFLEKISTIEQKAKYQIDRVAKMAVNKKTDPFDKSRYKANADAMDSNALEWSGSEEDVEDRIITKSKKNKQSSGVYIPPKLASVPYEEDSKAERERKMLERAKKRALNSSLIQELKEEYLDMPAEITHTNTLRNTRLKMDEERQNYEEEFFTRLPVTKKEKHSKKLLNSLTMGKLGADITYFEDISALEGKLPFLSKKRKKSSASKLKTRHGFKKKKY